MNLSAVRAKTLFSPLSDSSSSDDEDDNYMRPAISNQPIRRRPDDRASNEEDYDEEFEPEAGSQSSDSDGRDDPDGMHSMKNQTIR